MVDEAAKALAAWLEIARPVEAIAARVEAALAQRHTIGLSGYEALSVLAGRRGWTPMPELCRSIQLSQPRISRLVAHLADDGLLEREPDGGDGRSFKIRLTRKGRRVHGAAAESVTELIGRAAGEPGPVAALLRESLSQDG